MERHAALPPRKRLRGGSETIFLGTSNFIASSELFLSVLEDKLLF
jgi:hypothetical protein